MRPPSIPLINVDPYFSLWSPYSSVTDGTVKHWTGADNTVIGTIIVDGIEYGFLGDGHKNVLKQTHLEITSFTTELIFENEKIKFFVKFCSPLRPDDLKLMSEPIGYIECNYISKDGLTHNVEIKVTATEELCLNKKGEDEVVCQSVSIDGVSCFKMGSKSQNILNRSGDNLRIDWGYFFLASNNTNANICETKTGDMKALQLTSTLLYGERLLIVLAYDDIKSIEYFGHACEAYWKHNGTTIEILIRDAFSKYDEILSFCDDFSNKLSAQVEKCGNEKYLELLNLSIRQIMAAHKLIIDENGELIYISKECFSNGCAGTVDVTYPSSPFFLLFNTELLEAMLKPIFRYAKSGAWEFEFAPHDIGQYPLCNGQFYHNNERAYQMPIEECGNMLIMCGALAKLGKAKELLLQNKDLLKSWACYLIKCGLDPENQLCTDDFSGHLAHNCNLSAKAVMGIKGYALIAEFLGDKEEVKFYSETAQNTANEWMRNAKSDDGWYKHTFNSNEGYSLKYNLVWDKVLDSKLFAPEVFSSEINKYKSELKPYGVPLDQRADYTKSDWMLWVACFADNKEDFCRFSDVVWSAYTETASRVPMTDWYFSSTAKQCTWTEDDFEMGFQHRSVQGGLFMKLLIEKQ